MYNTSYVALLHTKTKLINIKYGNTLHRCIGLLFVHNFAHPQFMDESASVPITRFVNQLIKLKWPVNP